MNRPPEEIADLIADAAAGDEYAAEQLAQHVFHDIDAHARNDVKRFVLRLADRFRELRRITGYPSSN